MVTFPQKGLMGAVTGVGEPCMPVMVRALPRNNNVCVHTCALKTVLHTMRGDKAASAWVVYVKPFVGLADGKDAAVQSEIAMLCDEYADVFEQPGLPVRRHRPPH